LKKNYIEIDITLSQLFINAGLASSGKEIKRLIAGGSTRVNDILLSDSNLRISGIETSTVIKLSVGKKRHALIKLS
jgi:tyrosyl-tRNA synthetase